MNDEELREAVVQAYAGESLRVELSTVTAAARRRLRLVIAVAVAVLAVGGVAIVAGVLRGGQAPPTPGETHSPVTTGPTEEPREHLPGGNILPVPQRDVTCETLVLDRLAHTPGLLPDDLSLPPLVFRDDEGPEWIQLYVGDRVIVPCVQLAGRSSAAVPIAYAMPNPTAGAIWLAQPLDFQVINYEGEASWIIGRAPDGAQFVRISAGGQSYPGQIHDGYFFAFAPYTTLLAQHPELTTVTAYTSDRIDVKNGPDGAVASTPR